jgi:GTPase involved in cell partitioning and DNA repair
MFEGDDAYEPFGEFPQLVGHQYPGVTAWEQGETLDLPGQDGEGGHGVVREVSCNDHTVFVMETGEVYTCGQGTHGRLGHGEGHSGRDSTVIVLVGELFLPFAFADLRVLFN